MSLVVDTHRQYLADDVRVQAFRQAIAETVRSGDTVLDLGSGTGILGLFACAAGARRVYSVEETGLIDVARAVARANGVEDRIVFVQRSSLQTALPERVDVVVCDFIGGFGYDAALIEDGTDARDRFLKPGGRMVPGAVDVALAPIEDAATYDQIEFWSRRLGDLDFAPARQWAANTGYPVALAADAMLAPAIVASRIDLLTATTAAQAIEAEFAVSRAGTLHGLGAWFHARLSPGVTLSNAPDAAARMNRRNVFLPVERPTAVEAGDRIRARVHIIPTETVATWDVDVRAAGGGPVKARCRQSTLRGMLVSRDELRRTQPTFVPTLTARGDARRLVLTLCDSRRSLADIEREVFLSHPDLFRTSAEAQAFVAEVVLPYAQ
jgi:precorrin-6B methylase 2